MSSAVAAAAEKSQWTRTLAHGCFSDLLRFEDVQRNAAIKGRRQALIEAGAPLTAETLSVRQPRPGMMRL